MKCFQHDTDAVAICAHCGRGMCKACADSIPTTAGQRLTCSAECAKAMARHDGSLETLLQKSRQSARANSIYCYLCGGMSGGATVAAWYWMPVPLLMWFTGASAVVLIVSGFWFGRGARKIE